MNQTNGILITGLRRSGTTIFWETFRQDPSTLCFDEPFHPRLWLGDRENHKGTWTELGAAWQREAWATNTDLSPILPADELNTETTAAQRGYFASLFGLGPKVVIDTVRGWNKFPALAENEGPGPLVIHLLRSPASWVTAHMLPSGGHRLRYRLGDRYRRLSFFRRRSMFNYYHYQEIIDAAIAARHPMWSHVKATPDALARAPAHVRLLAFWWAVAQTQAMQLAKLPQDRVLTVTLEDFAHSPQAVMTNAYACAGWLLPALDYNGIKSTRDGFRPEDRRWQKAFETVGIPETLLPSRSFSAKAFLSALPEMRF